MNDTIYNQVLIPYISHKDRIICTTKDLWLIPIKRIHNDELYCSLLADIILHAGSPCVHRYCICTYFSKKDKSCYIRENFKYYINDLSN
jgi:hypothetical protein